MGISRVHALLTLKDSPISRLGPRDYSVHLTLSHLRLSILEKKYQLTSSFPNNISTYGRASRTFSLKNWQIKGAERFIISVRPLSSEYLAIRWIDSGLTVKKNPEM